MALFNQTEIARLPNGLLQLLLSHECTPSYSDPPDFWLTLHLLKEYSF